MMPGITHSFERSITSLSLGITTFGPTSTIFLSFTSMIWFFVTVPLAGSIKFPARERPQGSTTRAAIYAFSFLHFCFVKAAGVYHIGRALLDELARERRVSRLWYLSKRRAVCECYLEQRPYG